MDPLTTLPTEIVLRILEFASPDSLAKLTRLNQAWHGFIDADYADVIYAAKVEDDMSTGAAVRGGAEPADAFRAATSFAKYGHETASWKEACRRRMQLARNWNAYRPTTTESIIHVDAPEHFVWRFKPDFARRLVISTSQAGGVFVTDMDTGAALWSLQGDGEVRGYAHLEYEPDTGTAVWDRFGNTLEVWRTDLAGLPRGQFRQVELLHHDAETRGFQLSYCTLCVVSTDGHGFVYNVPPGEEKPTLRTRLDIPHGAVGHLDQNERAVMYSMGAEGYHFYDKTTGESLGQLRPHQVDPFKMYHVNHPTSPRSDFAMVRREILRLVPSDDQDHAPFPPRTPQQDRLTPCRIIPGALRSGQPIPAAVHTPPISDDEWGAGMLDGNTMVGVSRGGRVVVCSDWERALRSDADLAAVTSIIECEPSNGAEFDLGGWLSISETAGGKRVLFEIRNKIYILTLDANAAITTEAPVLVATTSLPDLGVPVSFMGVYDDCIMSTFTMVRPTMEDSAGVDEHGEIIPTLRVTPTKIIRVLSFAPES
ncbi:hypothetical protein PFICI_06122 [Pestalotiopsis fici W106-1]|uniref:F-box domain-containing protein n=1 Tax=Pestalotiopsis fici (strain W106-1 / CGMCC3.15140) TaxID=1229662 RepID=W3X4Y4_PESFW|nr:uncharacterized protein PFICI_06122 [Pestalotiopsis fici W106-1]ETS81120.1 hypothetical protein PFICI_06122 [Pestalotiopsis fici W106-1]